MKIWIIPVTPSKCRKMGVKTSSVIHSAWNHQPPFLLYWLILLWIVAGKALPFKISPWRWVHFPSMLGLPASPGSWISRPRRSRLQVGLGVELSPWNRNLSYLIHLCFLQLRKWSTEFLREAQCAQKNFLECFPFFHQKKPCKNC